MVASHAADPALEQTIGRLRRKGVLDRLVGSDPAFLDVVGRIPAFAGSNATVLIEGETGTGKELFARALHYHGDLAEGPFVPVNCGALPDSLLEDELFGHERGAFTDARTRRDGLLAAARRGTIFLDEVDSLTPRAQVALLRVLQDRHYRALGSNREHAAEVRFVAASNAPLRERVEAGQFRDDLFFRLNVLRLFLPPLRERPGDILELVRHFLLRHGGPSPPRLSADAEAALLAYPWPGNIRELENAIIRGIHLRGVDGLIRVDSLGLTRATPQAGAPESASLDLPFREAKARVIRAFEREYLARLMTRHAGNITRAAATAGKDRRELGRLLKKHALRASEFGAR